MELNVDPLRRLASYHPERPAVLWQGHWISYGDLYERACRAAGCLARSGVGRGDRVGILSTNHIAYLDLLFAAPMLGFILVPFNHRLDPAELADLADYTRPKLLFYGPEFSESARRMDVEALPREALQEGAAAGFDADRPDAEDVALLLFTGGTTGLPKAAMISYRQMLTNAFNTVFTWGLTQEDRYILCAPMFHAALGVLALPLLYLGGSVILQERFDPGEYLRWTEEHRPTLADMVPTMFQTLSAHPDFDRTDLSSLRWAISGGAPCPAPVRAAFRKAGVRFKLGYGLTEAGVNCFHLDLDEAETHPESVGRPMPHLWARVMDGDTEAGTGEVGELCLSGPVLMKGYWELAGKTAEALRRDPDGSVWLRTGDQAYRDAAGRYFIVGREKEMFVSGGQNVYPVEVERALYDHPAVAECAVVAIPDPTLNKSGLAAVVPKPGASVRREELLDFLRERLASYKTPRSWIFLDELPKSGAGKVLKRDLAALYAKEGRGD